MTLRFSFRHHRAALLGVALVLSLGCQSQDAAPQSETSAEEPATMTEAPRLAADQIDDALATPDLFFLDVRRPDEIAEIGTVDGYVNIPLSELPDRLDEVPRDRPILTA